MQYFKLLFLIIILSLLLIASINYDYINYFTIMLMIVVLVPYSIGWFILQHFVKNKLFPYYYKLFTIFTLMLLTLIFIFQN